MVTCFGQIITTSRRDQALEMMVDEGNHPLLGREFRLVKYYNLPRLCDISHHVPVGKHNTG